MLTYTQSGRKESVAQGGHIREGQNGALARYVLQPSTWERARAKRRLRFMPRGPGGSGVMLLDLLGQLNTPGKSPETWLASFGMPTVRMPENPHPKGSVHADVWEWDAKLALIREGLREWAKRRTSGRGASAKYRPILKGAAGKDIGEWLNLASAVHWKGFAGPLTGKGSRFEEEWEVNDPVALIWLSASCGIQTGWLGVCPNCGKVFCKASTQEFRCEKCPRCRKNPEKERRAQIQSRRPAFSAYRKMYERAYYYTYRRKVPLMSGERFNEWAQQVTAERPEDPSPARLVRPWVEKFDPRKHLDLGQPRQYLTAAAEAQRMRTSQGDTRV